MFRRLREHPRLAPIFDDKLTRARVLSWATAAVDLAYGVLTLSSGVIYGSWWSAAVGLYYGAMFVMALRIALGIRKTSRMSEGTERSLGELRVYRDSALTLLLFNAVLTGVTFQMVNYGLARTYPPFLIYGVAAFTFGYLGVAIAGIVRAKSDDPYLEQAVSLVSLAKAIVGMFFLTTALISEFGGESETFRFSMESGVGAVCLSSVVVIALYMLVKARRERRRLAAA